jgi:hypothetical protein
MDYILKCIFHVFSEDEILYHMHRRGWRGKNIESLKNELFADANKVECNDWEQIFSSGWSNEKIIFKLRLALSRLANI